MATLIFSISFVFLISLHLVTPTPPLPSPVAPPPLVPPTMQKACNATTLYDFCVASLSIDPQSTAADIRGLSSIAVKLAATNASDTADFISGLARSTSSVNSSALKKLLQSCTAKYANASSALREALGSLADENYDYAAVNVAAAAEYPKVCRALFRLRRPQLPFPAEMARREVVLEQLCIVSEEIISLLLQSF